jgi:hypothetical protein
MERKQKRIKSRIKENRTGNHVRREIKSRNGNGNVETH